MKIGNVDDCFPVRRFDGKVKVHAEIVNAVYRTSVEPGGATNFLWKWAVMATVGYKEADRYVGGR